MTLLFIPPEKKYAASFAEALREGMEITSIRDDEIQRIENDFDRWWQEKNDLSKMVTLPDGTTVPRVPYSEWWLLDGKDMLGRVSLRHSLTDFLHTYGGHIGYAVRASARRQGHGRAMINHALEAARNLGINPVLVTCRVDNEGSIRIIEGAGGVLENTIPHYIPGAADMRRYWITL